MSDNIGASDVASATDAIQSAGIDYVLARQPIFDQKKKVFGYELLFRSGNDNVYDHTDGDMATAQVLNRTVNMSGLRSLLGGARGFINFTRQTLINGDYRFLPNQTVVVELLEDVEPDEQVVEACRQVKDSGYMLALDDYAGNYDYKPLIGLVDIIKVDFMDSTPQQRKGFVRQFANVGVQLLAEKVETHEEFAEAMELGYKYAQGYFFCKPEMMRRRDVPACRTNYMRFLQEVSRLDPDLDRIEGIVKQEVSLSYKLLHYLNSAALGLPTKITSIKHALTLLGVVPLRKWAALVATTCMGEDKPRELMRTTLVRAHFCELIGADTRFDDREVDLFLLGLLSTLDALLDQPIDELVMDLPLASDVKTALLAEAGSLGTVLRLAMASDRGDVPTITSAGNELHLSPLQITRAYHAAIQWADEIIRT